MPIYCRKCTDCDIEFEIEVPYTEIKKIKCPKCNKKRKLITIFFPTMDLWKCDGCYKQSTE